MGLDRRPGTGGAPLGQDPAVEVMEDDGDDERDDQDRQRPVDDEVHERELEDVEADVLVELGVLNPEVAAVAEEDPVLPLADRARRRDERHDQRQHDVEPPGVGPHELLVAADHLVLLHGAEVVAGQPVAGDQVDPHNDEEDRPEDPEEPELYDEQGGEDVVETHRGEPESVGIDVRQGPQGGQQDDQDDDGAHDPPPGPSPRAGRAGSGKVPGCTHGGSLTSGAERIWSRPSWAPPCTDSPNGPEDTHARWERTRRWPPLPPGRCRRSPSSHSPR